MDMLALNSTSADIPRLVTLLRAAQDERNALVVENIKLESKLTKAEIAITTAQQEDRAPTWPPAEYQG